MRFTNYLRILLRPKYRGLPRFEMTPARKAAIQNAIAKNRNKQ